MSLTTNQEFFFINNVTEQLFENSGQLIAIVKKIVKIIDKNVTVAKAYRTGEQPGNLQKNRPIISSLLDKQQSFSVVRHAHRLKYTDHKNVYITEDLCQEWKAALQAQLPLNNEKRQEYRNVYFRGKMLVFRNQLNQGESSLTHSQCSPIASRPGTPTSSSHIPHHPTLADCLPTRHISHPPPSHWTQPNCILAIRHCKLQPPHHSTLGCCLATNLLNFYPTKQPTPSCNFSSLHLNLYPSHHRTSPTCRLATWRRSQQDHHNQE